MPARKLTEADVTFTIECEHEEEPIEGNASAIDPETDAETCKWIRDQLDRGNEWAWCSVKVTAKLKTASTLVELEGADYLGCCSYKSEEDFRQPGGYFDDMKHEALADLQRQIDELAPLICDC